MVDDRAPEDDVPEAATLTANVPPERPAYTDFVLTVTSGPDKGRIHEVDAAHAARVLIGQGPICDLVLTDRQVSRRHAALERVGARLRVTDLGSTNGTYVDRVRVLAAELAGGEYLRLGTTLLRVEARPSTAPPPATDVARDAFGHLVGRSPEMQRLYPLCDRLAASLVPVIIEGETGTGKEVLAESIHELGARSGEPFVVFDCTAVPTTLLESELFGHERGAFTGAVAQRRGVFEQAHGGTLFIDEIGDLDLALQPKLLRAIERFEIRRVGGDKWQRVDVRIIAATRRNLDHEVEVGRFRDDLFHRLAVARIELPPLRSRRGDIVVLARHFWEALGGHPSELPEALLQRWEDSSWPGNVRELRNTVARHLALGELAGEPRARSVPAPTGDVCADIIAQGLPFPEARDRMLEEFEQRYVEHVLARHAGDLSRAAEASGIGKRYLQKLRARIGKGGAPEGGG